MEHKALLKRVLIPQRRSASPHIVPGLYPFSREDDDAQISRCHLRVEPDGSGLLLINASRAVRLSICGTFIAKQILEQAGDEAILEQVAAGYRESTAEAVKQDIDQLRRLVEHSPQGGSQMFALQLDDPAFSEHPPQLLSPITADLSVGKSNAGTLCELIDRLWRARIPQLSLNISAADMQDSSLAQHVVRAVEHAEDLGMIAGVRASGLWFAENSLVDQLAQAGVDYLCLVLASKEEAVHDSLCAQGDFQAALKVIQSMQQNEVCPLVQFPLILETVPGLGETLSFIQELGVRDVFFFAIAQSESMAGQDPALALPARSMRQTAACVEEEAEEAEVRYVWQPPVKYNPSRSIEEQVQNGPRCSTDFSIRVTEQGMVLPPRGAASPAGNLLSDDWEHIWSHHSFERYRKRSRAATHCEQCPGLTLCAVDCPADEKGWSDDA